jgi:hypothetical protein
LGFELPLLNDDSSGKTTFDEAIEESIEAALSLLGNVSKEKVYRHLECTYDLKKENIPRRIGEFAHAFEETFGSVAKLLEIKIIEQLHSKYKNFSYSPMNEDIDFIEFINNFQQYLENLNYHQC